jgi:hypothetical protein
MKTFEPILSYISLNDLWLFGAYAILIAFHLPGEDRLRFIEEIGSEREEHISSR